MATEKKSKTAKNPAPPSTGWRASSPAPQWNSEIHAARHRRDDWTLGGVLKSTVTTPIREFMALTQQPLSNVMNLLPGRIVDDKTPKTLPQILKGTPIGRGFENLGQVMRDVQGNLKPGDPGYPKSPNANLPRGTPVPQPPPTPASIAAPLDPNVSGPRAQAIAAAAQRRRLIEEQRREEIRQQADALVAGEKDQRPYIERAAVAAEKLPIVGNAIGALWDSRAGLASSANDAGFTPEAGQAMEFLNFLNWSPADLSMAPIEMAARKLAGKSVLAPFRYEGLGRLPFQQADHGLFRGKAPFRPHEPVKYQTPMAQLEESAARRKEGLIQQQQAAGERHLSQAEKQVDFKRQWDEERDAARAEEQQRAATQRQRDTAQQQFKNQWDAEIAKGRIDEQAAAAGARSAADAQAQFQAEWAAELEAKRRAEGITQGWRAKQSSEQGAAEQWAASRSAARAESAGFAPDPSGSIDVGWRARVTSPVKPPEPPMLNRAEAPLNDDFIARPMGRAEGSNGIPLTPPPPEPPLPAARLADAPPSVGWRASLPQRPIAPQAAMPVGAPMRPSQPLAAPDAPIAPPRPPEPLREAPMPVQEVPAAPPQLPPAPRAQEAPPQPITPAAGLEGAAMPPAAAPVVGAGDAAPVGPSVAPSFPEKVAAMTPDARAKIWESLSKEERAAVNEILTKDTKGRFSDTFSRRKKLAAGAAIVGGAAGLGAARPENAEEGGAWPSFARDVLGTATALGGIALAGKIAAGPAGKAASGAMLSLERSLNDFASTAKAWQESKLPFSLASQRLGVKAKRAVEYMTSQDLMSSATPGGKTFGELLEGFAVLSRASEQRAQDVWGVLRQFPAEAQQKIAEALRDPSKMADLARTDGHLGAWAASARGHISEMTQQMLTQQFAVERAAWDALSDAERKLYGDALKDEGLAFPSPRTQALVEASRARMIASGALIPGTEPGTYAFKDQMLSAAEAMQNAEVYLQRKFAPFEGARGVKPEQIIAKNPGLTPAEKQRIYELLGDKQARAGDPRVLRERGMLLAREDLSPAFRQALGEIVNDVGYLVPKTISDMEKHVALSQMREAVALNGDWVMQPGETPDLVAARWGEQPVQLADDVTRNGILAGRWVRPEVADAMEAHFGFHNPGMAESAIRRATGLWKMAKTVMNPASHARQAISNLVAFDIAGNGLVDALRRTRNALHDLSVKGPLYQAYRDAGGTVGSFADAELSASMHRELLQLEPGPDGVLGHLGRFGEVIHAIGKKANRAWQVSDDASRMGLFGLKMEEGMSPAEAMRYVRDNLYDASRMSRLERMVSGRGISNTMANPSGVAMAADGVGLLANVPFFMSTVFGAKKTARSVLGVKPGHWMPLSDPARAMRASKYYLLPAIAGAAAGKEYMDSRPDYAKPLLDKQLPTNVPLPRIVSTFLGTDGMPQFLDVGAFVPWGEMARATYDTSKLSGDESIAGKVASAPLAMMRGGANPILQSVIDVAQNRDTFSGRPIYNPSLGGNEIAAKSLGQLTRNLAPDFMPGIPAALVSGDPRDLLKEGGQGMAKLGAGAYNSVRDAMAYYSNAPAPEHMADYRFRDQTLARGILGSLLGVRTYEGDAERNATMRDIERRAMEAEENKGYRRAQRDPARTEAQRNEDAARNQRRLRNIRNGGPVSLPALTPDADTLRALLFGR